MVGFYFINLLAIDFVCIFLVLFVTRVDIVVDRLLLLSLISNLYDLS